MVYQNIVTWLVYQNIVEQVEGSRTVVYYHPVKAVQTTWVLIGLRSISDDASIDSKTENVVPMTPDVASTLE